MAKVETSNRFECLNEQISSDNDDEKNLSSLNENKFSEFSSFNFHSILTAESYWDVKDQPEQREKICHSKKKTIKTEKTRPKIKPKEQKEEKEEKEEKPTAMIISPSIPQYRSLKSRSTNQYEIDRYPTSKHPKKISKRGNTKTSTHQI